MLERINQVLSGWKMTLVGGVFLLASFLLPRMRVPAGEKLAWVCVLLCGLPYLKWLSNAAVRTIKGAITLSMCINFAAILLSVRGILTPTTGALVHNAGSCFVVLLAALLYDRTYR